MVDQQTGAATPGDGLSRFMRDAEDVRALGVIAGRMTAPTDEALREALHYDPLSAAEQASGKSYKDDDPTMYRGFVNNIFHGGRKEALLTAADDTTFSNDLERYLRIAGDEGLDVVLKLPFNGRSPHGEDKEEHLYILAHRAEGILLCFDTYGGTKVNGGKFYYNWQAENFDEGYRLGVTSSGGLVLSALPDEQIWAGDHDCREALRFHLRQLRAQGRFVTPWRERPFLWLLHYMDTKAPDGAHVPWSPAESERYNRLTEERLNMLPDWVREMVGPAQRKAA